MQTNRTYSIIFFYWGGDVCTRVCVENVITRLINFAFVLLNFFVFWCLYIPLRDFCNSEQPTENKNNITQRETVSCCCCCVVSSDSNTIHFLVSLGANIQDWQSLFLSSMPVLSTVYIWHLTPYWNVCNVIQHATVFWYGVFVFISNVRWCTHLRWHTNTHVHCVHLIHRHLCV